MNQTKYLIIAVIVTLTTLTCLIVFNAIGANSAPVVSNIKAQQRPGTKLVDITYDVDDPDGDTLTVTVEISDDGGNTFKVPAKTFKGDVGSGIKPGKGKKVEWDAGRVTSDFLSNPFIFYPFTLLPLCFLRLEAPSDDIIFSERRV